MFNACLIIVFAVLLLHFTDGYLEVTPTKDTISKAFGETFLSLCKYNGTNNIQWSHGDQQIEGTRIGDTLKLEIREVNFGDQGTYWCSDNEERDSVTLEVYKKPMFINKKPNQNLTFGENGRILCKVESVNTTLYEWKLNKGNLPESDRIKIQNGEYLEIDNVTYNDAGVYVCAAIVTTTTDIHPSRYTINVFVTGLDPPPTSTKTVAVSLPRTTNTGIVSDRDDLQVDSGGRVHRHASIVLLSFISMLILITVA